LKLVALKILPPKKAREEQRYLARFQREMILSQRVSHPHLAQALEAGVYQGVNYIAMEYIPGRNHTSSSARKALFPSRVRLEYSRRLPTGWIMRIFAA